MRIKSISVLGALCLFASFAFAQGQDFSKVQIKATKVAGNVYMLEGSGGNIGVSVGPDGLLIVDDQYAPLADKIKAALKELGQGKLKFVINTHWHGDHTGGNALFGVDSTIVAHANVRKRLGSESVNRAGQKLPPAPKEALPLITFDESLSVHFNGEEIKAVHYPNGHTDGDGVIFFTQSNVVHMGDDFFAGKFPFVDLSSGGSVEGLARNIGNVLGKLPAGVKIIPGHGPISTVDDLKAYHQMLLETIEIVRKQMQSGKSLDDIKTAGMPEKYKDWGSGFISTPVWIETIQKSLSKSTGN
ncbi:MAG TPA: MBL fold metallo-hydrolase [Blastocatellia bacterium]|nr:MBL fold metallo-hydrolase [Blastocatellia bacterium]